MTIPATLTPGEAADRVWDAAVVGAGPAGTVAATILARRGRSVLLIDRATFPRGKVCGCCLNATALAGLYAAGLSDLPTRLGGVPLGRVTVSAAGRDVTLRLPAGVSVSRAALDAALIHAAIAAGAAFLPGTSASLTNDHGSTRRISLGGVHAAARVVLAADGLNGRLTATDGGAIDVRRGSRIGAGAMFDSAPDWYRSGMIYMATGRGGYVGLVRVEVGRLDVAAAFDTEFVRASGGPGAAADAILRESGWPTIPGLAEGPWKGTPPLTRRPRRVAGDRWFAIGDAAGYVEPFTGEGMAWAVASAVAVVPFAEAAVRQWDDRLATGWRREHARVVGRRTICRVVAAGLRSPTATRLVVRLLSVLPALAIPFVRAVNRSAPVSLEALA